MIEFLSDLFKSGLQYSTLNTYRSAISSTIPSFGSTPLGQHPLVCKFMKGTFNSRPPQPKYNHTWDVSLVTKFLEGLPCNEELDTSRLTKKCAMLLALSGSKRQSDLKALDKRFRKQLPEGITFCPATLTKTRTPKRSVEFFFPSFPGHRNLCPVACIEEYIKRSSTWRKENSESYSQLFLSPQQPHKPVTSASIGRWLKDIMRDAGVDIGIFKAHSTRGAASSAAKDRGVAIKDILQAADWTRETTFNRFYYRPQYSKAFAQAVLTGESLL